MSRRCCVVATSVKQRRLLPPRVLVHWWFLSSRFSTAFCDLIFYSSWDSGLDPDPTRKAVPRERKRSLGPRDIFAPQKESCTSLINIFKWRVGDHLNTFYLYQGEWGESNISNTASQSLLFGLPRLLMKIQWKNHKPK